MKLPPIKEYFFDEASTYKTLQMRSAKISNFVAYAPTLPKNF